MDFEELKKDEKLVRRIWLIESTKEVERLGKLPDDTRSGNGKLAKYKYYESLTAQQVIEFQRMDQIRTKLVSVVNTIYESDEFTWGIKEKRLKLLRGIIDLIENDL